MLDILLLLHEVNLPHVILLPEAFCVFHSAGEAASPFTAAHVFQFF